MLRSMKRKLTNCSATTHAKNFSRCTCFLDKMIHLRSRYRINRGQEGPTDPDMADKTRR